MGPLTNEREKIYRQQKVCCVCKKNLVLMLNNIKRLDIIFITLENIEKLLMIFSIIFCSIS